MKIVFGIILPVLLLVPNVSSYGEQAHGTLKVDIISTTGERAGHYGIVLQIYQDTNETPMVVPLSANPYVVNLALGHQYKLEVYVNSMYADVDFVDFSSSNQKVDFSVPIPGSARLGLVYADGNNPIEGALVSLRSDDGTYRYWTNSTTDSAGNTNRFWLQPTLLKDDYYAADISLGDRLSYTFSPITIDAGRSQDIKIITPWPKIIDQLIVVSVYKSESEKISGLDADLVVELYDSNDQKIASSKVTHKGDAHFSNLKVGTYKFRVVNLEEPQNEEWGSVKVTLSGKTDPIRIFTKPYESQNEDTSDLISNNSESISTNSSETIKEPINEQPTPSIPEWIRNVADWWAKGQISDAEFLKAIEYLVNNNIITVQNLKSS